MRLAAGTMVRDEADIIEAFVRHTLARVDELLIVDHLSIDGTTEILAALVEEGLPLTVQRDDSPIAFQAKTMTGIMRTLIGRGADLVFALDADEFLKLPDRARFVEFVAALPINSHVALAWQTYVPDLSNDPAASQVLGLTAQRLRKERHGLHKVAVTRHFAASPTAALSRGNHFILDSSRRHPAKTRMLRQVVSDVDIAALAHLPVRSAEQFVRKIRTTWMSRPAAEREEATPDSHPRAVFDEIEAHGVPSPRRLREMICNYSVAGARWQPLDQIELVHDPLPCSPRLRYAHLARQ